MPFSAAADSSRAQLSFVAETTPGVTPTSPAWQDLRMTGESINPNRTATASQEIRSDANPADLITTGETVSGDINFELSYGSFDAILAAVLRGTWNGNVLKAKVNRQSFSILKRFLDTGKAFVYRGAEFTSLSLANNDRGVVGGALGLTARGHSKGIPSGSTFLAASTTPVYNTVTHLQNLKINGVAYAEGVKNMALSYSNTPRDQTQIGSLDLAGIGMGTRVLTLTFEAFYGNSDVITDIYDADQEFTLGWDYINAGGSYNFDLPRNKFNSMKVTAGSGNQDVMMQTAITSLYDATADAVITVTRTPAP